MKKNDEKKKKVRKSKKTKEEERIELEKERKEARKAKLPAIVDNQDNVLVASDVSIFIFLFLNYLGRRWRSNGKNKEW